MKQEIRKFYIIMINSLTFGLINVNSASYCSKMPTIKGMMMKYKNAVKKLREQKMMSKAELARLAGVSPVTIDRIERGEDSRMETKRKIILALGFSLSDKDKVFSD
jgi:DNA-binding XRE family transcriptional regulator